MLAQRRTGRSAGATPMSEPAASKPRALLRAADRWRFAACIWYTEGDGWIGVTMWGTDIREQLGRAMVVDFCTTAGMAPRP